MQFVVPKKIIFGVGSIEKVRELAEGSCVLITTQGMLGRGMLKKLDMDFKYTRLVDPEPSIQDVEKTKYYIKGQGYKTIIGLGGGSVMDVAKTVGADMGMQKIMIPTTAGSGSEVTHEAVLKMIDGKKKAFVHEKYTPDVAVLDPQMTMTMPPKLTLTTGLDALAHAIECYNSKNSNELTGMLAYKAIEIIQTNLQEAIENNPDARERMSFASLIAGMAFGNSGTTLCHALSYPLSNRGMSHSEAIAVLLPHFMEFNGFGKTEIEFVKGITKDLKVEIKGDPVEMAKEAWEDKRHLERNPKKVEFEDIVEIYEKLSTTK